ncbi:dihydrodipicolinate reductase [Leeuwenhoekiella aestuarii]|uniref:4-hydroxy-tetrahydrodipicolinate reductase n=1 Tax=Leeuwenhoekiella aestuarii TaxID=2249426 RepID=A0A4Q0NVN2_9FLAO|nr:4-hydroxy-tetrahydrodipicolinate reductase [Leeuwenhoekiella aestuarii]RXG15346.1 dihydrodipicolinate reductase [Leeuwenhoekiella aestuarii]RXG17547.1 dihydrodipicolinate reductase [Leeuwenhoekiella aestuarii]
MKIALLGYGRMGKTIEKLATERGHTVVKTIDQNDDYDFNEADVAIDFSVPDAAVNNISACLKAGVPVVSGTTGWLAKYEDMVSLCKKNNGAFIYASNFSVGVNIFFELNKQLAKMMQHLKDYNVSMTEVHHIHKLDAPSGTAITLAEGILDHSHNTDWVLDKEETDKITIKAEREGEVPGTHTIKYESQVDEITIEHKAHNRNGFALGAIIAAEWLRDKTGVYSMKDVLNLS